MRDANKYKYDLSIIIVSYNTCSLIIKCVESIYKFSENLRIQIIVSDNGSSDNTVKILEKRFPDVNILKNNRNLGFAVANNRAIHYCEGRFVLFLNPDIILIEPVFTKAIQFLEEKQDAGLVGCKLINPDMSIQKSFHTSFPTLTNKFLEAIYVEKLLDNYTPYNQKNTSIKKVASITGAFIFAKIDLIKELGGFDECFFMYCEDIDLSFRVTQMGYSNYYLHNISVHHYLGASTKKNRKSYFGKVLQKESAYKYFMKHQGKPSALIYRILMVIGAIIRLIVLLALWPFIRVLKVPHDINFYNSLLKYLRVASWGIGFEKWTKNP